MLSTRARYAFVSIDKCPVDLRVSALVSLFGCVGMLAQIAYCVSVAGLLLWVWLEHLIRLR